MQAAFDIREEGQETILALRGDWTVWTIAGVDALLRALPRKEGRALTVDVTGLGRMDVAGAWLVERTARHDDAPLTLIGTHDAAGRLFSAVRASNRETPQPQEPLRGVIAVFDRLGRSVADLRREALLTLEFLGHTLVTLGRVIAQPRRIRWVSVVSVMEQAGLNALPIIMMLSFFIGVVVAFLGSRILGDFGASVFTVELVGFSMLREFGIVITAVLLAGRTDSAFTAQIGAMKMRQEIDAMRALGINPMEAIVVPRLIAMLVMTPILTFAAIIAGLLGGLLVCWAALGVSPVMFVTRIQEAVPAQHFWAGMVKAPVMAVVLALVGCRHGLETGTDVTSLGKRVTSSVVQAIFLVIVIDALFAIWFLEMDW
ncbi:MAG: MlaE family lipid ABC transporter permease subunit [Hyphomonadaceae bacterium]|nr:MlaE family lipid ABC transporter permease subunit [Hyphomonadaceae bacterium]